jgi:hypothetical protein
VEGRGGYMVMDLTSPTKSRKLNKTAEQLPRYQVLLVLEKAASPPFTAVSHNGALNALYGSSLTRLMRRTQSLLYVELKIQMFPHEA